MMGGMNALLVGYIAQNTDCSFVQVNLPVDATHGGKVVPYS
jgi:hypothetical protein